MFTLRTQDVVMAIGTALVLGITIGGIMATVETVACTPIRVVEAFLWAM